MPSLNATGLARIHPTTTYLTNTFRSIVDKHAAIKTKFLRGNDAPFMNPELRKAMYTHARLKRGLNKHPSKQNEVAFKK